ncbi:hypothetical protein QQS21_011173 [Conoideocrella luteorostrata]|uniref:Uncharacterized protein n=1 Tax=Conoideocrella luteorostrata TaxID=1105319 RepID=A0AAJ0FW49_9HYPO|nr:hypothetical protein QQS21_011173 [Conoideocrella luteorostrata]
MHTQTTVSPPSVAITAMKNARLPPELILHIIDCLVPSHAHAILPPRHIVTKTLLTLTSVCRTTYRQASRLLRQYCVYIDDSQRLATYLHCIPRLVPTLSSALSLRHITTLYLAPFTASSLDDLPTAEWVRELFCETCNTLRRLIIHMPFASLHPLDDHLDVRKTLRRGFEQLNKLEEFTCLAEYPSLSVPDAHADVWRLWPDLRYLALFGASLDNHLLWWDIATLSKLEQLVLARPQHWDAVNIKDEYFRKLPKGDVRLGRKTRILLMDAAYRIGVVDTTGWKEIDPNGRLAVEILDVPRPFYGDETEDELVTDWVKRGAVDGSLWEWRGDQVGGDDGAHGEIVG